jgi:hypothetical protein
MFSELSTGKSLANLGESIYLSLAIPLAPLVRVGLGTRVRESVVSGILLGMLCGVAVGVFLIVPPLPE